MYGDQAYRGQGDVIRRRSQNAIGTGVAGGMITATVLAIFLVPAFFVGVLRLVESRRSRVAEAPGLSNPQVAGE